MTKEDIGYFLKGLILVLTSILVFFSIILLPLIFNGEIILHIIMGLFLITGISFESYKVGIYLKEKNKRNK